MDAFYQPNQEHLTRLDSDWCCSYSGGKDSTALVTWIEWLRRSGWITVPTPKLVRSDTGVEEPPLLALAESMATLLTQSGWECVLVRPEIHERLYCQILGRGLPPIHPGIRRMRWCTRSTKIDPMNRWKDGDGVRLSITGLRLGESATRDGKILKTSCAAGGECGIPDPGEGKYSPILYWRTCQVIDWLTGMVDSKVREVMADVFPLTGRLVEIYEVERAKTLFEESEILSTARFGCIGCPAIGAKAAPPRSVVQRNGVDSPLNELYDVWFEARRSENRLVNLKKGKMGKPGPIRLETRKRLFARVMDIQQRAGVVLVTPEDEVFIRECWENKVYPRGWSEADEAVTRPNDSLFATLDVYNADDGP